MAHCSWDREAGFLKNVVANIKFTSRTPLEQFFRSKTVSKEVIIKTMTSTLPLFFLLPFFSLLFKLLLLLLLLFFLSWCDFWGFYD